MCVVFEVPHARQYRLCHRDILAPSQDDEIWRLIKILRFPTVMATNTGTGIPYLSIIRLDISNVKLSPFIWAPVNTEQDPTISPEGSITVPSLYLNVYKFRIDSHFGWNATQVYKSLLENHT